MDQILEELNEDRCVTERNPENKVNKLLQKVKYLEKENSDLQLDLEDVENTLQINKEMMMALMDPALNQDQAFKQALELMKKESAVHLQQIKDLRSERDQLKASNLLLEQVKTDLKSREDETIALFETERYRVIDAMEKKEYTLQLLESRLYDCEKFLRDLGREDDSIRERLKELKLNPDVERKKITNVVLANNKLTEQIKDLIEENDKLKTDMNFLECENESLRKIIAERQTPFSSGQDNGASTHRVHARPSDLADISELDLDKSSYDTNYLMDINKLLSLRHEYPDIFMDKMLKNYSILENKLMVAYKEIKKQKSEARFYKHKYNISEQNFKTLSENYEKSEVKRRQLEININSSAKGAAPQYGNKPVTYEVSEPRPTPPKNKRQNVYDAINQIKKMGLGGLSDSLQFQDISSILVTPASLNDRQNMSSDEEDNKSNILEGKIEDTYKD